MQQFFVTEEAIRENTARILGPDVNHIRNVLRLKCGDTVRVSTGDGTSREGAIASIAADEVLVNLDPAKEHHTELPIHVTLLQGLPKQDKLEWIIQKNVELGIESVIPVAMSRSVVKIEEKKVASRVERWNAIAKSAAEQSKRSALPTVGKPLSYKNALAAVKDYEHRFLPYENAFGMTFTRECLSKIKPGDRVAILIGPEGGFSPEEVELAEDAGFVCLSLGGRILRTETAGMCLMSALMLMTDPN